MSDRKDSEVYAYDWIFEVYGLWRDRIKHWKPVPYQMSFPTVVVESGATCRLCGKEIAENEIHMVGVTCVSIVNIGVDVAQPGEDYNG